MQRHLYDKDLPEAIGVAKEMRALVDSYGKKGERMLVGEVFIEDPETAIAYYGDGNDGLNLCFYFNFCFNPYRARRFRESVRTWERLLPPNAQPTYFLSNHDLPGRHIHRYAALSEKNTQGRARVAAMMLLTLRGTPFLYYGDEIGMRNLHIRKKDIVDPVGIRYWPIPVGRDKCRTPMQWDGSAGAGFTASDDPWLPINPNRTDINVAAQKDDPDSLFSFYRRLIRKRRGLPSLTRGGLTILDDAPDRLFCYLRHHENETTCVALNFSHGKETLSLPDRGGKWEVVHSSHRDEGERAAPGTIAIHPSEATLWVCKQ
jgi:alpha-glucosidase